MVLSHGRSLSGLVVVEVGKVVVGRQKTTTWQQSQRCLVIFSERDGRDGIWGVKIRWLIKPLWCNGLLWQLLLPK